MENILYFGGRKHKQNMAQEGARRQNQMAGPPKQWTHLTQFDSNALMELQRYIHKVWVHEHEMPQDEEALVTIREQVQKDFEEFLAHGGETPQRGSTLEEAYFGFQISLRTPCVCLINNQQPPQANTRICRKAFLDPHILMACLVRALESDTFQLALHRSMVGISPFMGLKVGEWGSMFETLTYDGEIAHSIMVLDIDPQTHHIIFYDSWPGNSLLSRTENNTGTAAIPYINRKGERLWMITPDDLEQIVYAVMMPQRQWEWALREV